MTLPAILQRRQQFAVVDVEEFIGGADDAPAAVCFAAPALGQFGPGMFVMPGVAVGQADHVHDVSGCAVQRRGAARRRNRRRRDGRR